MNKFDEVWSRLRGVLAFMLGAGIGVYETAVDKSDRPYLLAFAAGLIGIPLAGSIEAFLAKRRETLDQKNPPPP